MEKGIEYFEPKEVKRDCFAYRYGYGHGSCDALKELYCRKEECKFYKPCDKNVKKCEKLL